MAQVTSPLLLDGTGQGIISALEGIEQGLTGAKCYGVCSTAASTAAKEVTATRFALTTGSSIAVHFTVANTAANPTLNVNSTGAKPIYFNGSAISTSMIVAGGTYLFVYNGTQYDAVGFYNDIGVMTGATSGSTGSSGLVPRPAAGDQNKVLKGDGTWSAYTMSGATTATNGSTGFVPAPAIADKDKFLKGDGTWSSAGGGPEASTTTFSGNTITEVSASGTKTTVFNNDGTITETYPDGSSFKTIFNADGSISVVAL